MAARRSRSGSSKAKAKDGTRGAKRPSGGSGSSASSARSSSPSRPKKAGGASAARKDVAGKQAPLAPSGGSQASGVRKDIPSLLEELAPDTGKLYYRIGEVSKITEVKPYVLRYWESEFRWMAPQKSRSKQRLYRRKDIETILLVKRLLYEERYTIEGARRRLRELGVKKALELSAKPVPSTEQAAVAQAGEPRLERSAAEGDGALVDAAVVGADGVRADLDAHNANAQRDVAGANAQAEAHAAEHRASLGRIREELVAIRGVL